MQKTFDPHAIEQACYARWERAGWFSPSGEGAPYSIMIPPPNVTGTLHMGHAFQITIMDALIRYHRMAGRDTLWQVGMDHAGIATQMVVERQLNAEGKSKHDVGRDAFVDRVWQWKATSGGAITSQLRRLGASVDWSRERFTMDPAMSEAVTEVFVRLYDDGLIYRGKRLVNWDPVLHTALSDLEVVSEEEPGHIWHLRYPLADGPLADGTAHVVVATTRPETMLGDMAVAVHPEDERYRDLIGRTLALPLTDRRIPIIADDYVDPDFGTGCVKITPAHDFNDYEVGRRHGLEMLTVLDFDARVNDAAPAAYRGLPRFEARRRIVADLQAADLLERIDDHRSAVPRGDRSGEILEPLLTDQWYVSVQALAEPAIEAVRSGRIRFVPENWDRTYYEWMNNIQDWCISRQLWWGHRIPAWYTPDGQVIVARDEAQARERAGLSAQVPLRQDEDVLDTWFSSALWPFSTLGWPDRDAPDLRRYYPTSVLVTGFDIIFFWVARMIMMGLRFMGDVPFREVYIHGLVRDAEGQKMSKSKGNVLDPTDLIEGTSLEALLAKRTSGLMQPQKARSIEKATARQFPQGIPAFGTDALRFTFMAMATTGRDIRFDLGRIEGYRNFCNKLWNATRYVLMTCEDQELDGDGELGQPDVWIRSRLGRTLAAVDTHFQRYRFDLAAQALYEFTWNEFCDWYLELTKPVLRDGDGNGAAALGTRRNMLDVLETLLRALHPMMPFITEALWERVGPLAARRGETIMCQPWPSAGDFARDPEAERNMDWVTDFVLGIRQIRGEMDISPSRALPVLLEGAGEADRARAARFGALLTRLANLQGITPLPAAEAAPAAATALLGNMRLLVPLQGLVDIDDEIARIEKRLAKQRSELERIAKKLGNTNFLDRAPEDVVAEQRRRHAELEGAIAALVEQLDRLRAGKS